jgi:hypothetical protein
VLIVAVVFHAIGFALAVAVTHEVAFSGKFFKVTTPSPEPSAGVIVGAVGYRVNSFS